MRSPSPRAIASTVQSWRTLSVPSSILAVVDASGSMDDASNGRTRMEVLAEAAGIGLSFLPDHARVGLWVFSIDKGGPGQDWQVLEPMRRLDELAFGRTQRYALRERARADARDDRGRHGPLRHGPRGVPAGAAGLPARSTPTRSS